MSSSVDALSDSELRLKLIEYGFNVGPVTQTTRKILAKKLKMLMEDKSGTRFSMASAKYSSDETDDDASSSIKKKKKAIPSSTRRQTMATSMPPPTIPASPPRQIQTKRRQTRNLNSTDYEVSDNEGPSLPVVRSSSKEKSVDKSKKSPVEEKSKDDGETGSVAEIIDDESAKTTPIVVPKFGGGITKIFNDKSHFTAADVNSPKSYESSWRIGRTFDSSNLRSNTPKSTLTKDERYSINLPKPSISADSIRNDLRLPQDFTKKDDVLSNYESPYLSEFTRRLSSATSVSLSKPSVKVGQKYRLSSLSGTPDVNETDSNGHYTTYTSPRTYLSSSSTTYVTSSFDKTQRDGNHAYKSTSNLQREEMKNSHNMISIILLAVVVLFFGVLLIVYLGLETKTEFPLSSGDDIKVCDQNNYEMNTPGNTCIPENLVKETLQMLKQVYPILMEKAISAQCENTNKLPYLSEKELMNMVMTPERDESKAKELLKMAQFLVLQNPQWKLYPVKVPYSPEIKSSTINSIQDLVKIRTNEYIGLIISEPDVPWRCTAKNKIISLFTTFVCLAMVGVSILMVKKILIYYMKYRESKEKQVYNLASEIINMLEAHYQSTVSPGGTQESYLAINHIRDNLIPPKDRKYLNTVWEKAVKFLDENESRIRKEVQFVSGEEFQVWRWLPNQSPPNSPRSSSAPKMSKVWQGSAFETMDGSVNSPSCPPTPCLKIRHMFDPDVEFEEDWETRVKDAILEKCNDSVKILHIKVDRGSREGCVYIKCMSQEDAGQAYKALHGSWFDGHLVTVKYLRLERYHERFPESISYKTPLKPSNNQRLSMQANTWSNSTDAN